MSTKIFDQDQVGTEARNSIRGQRHRCNNPNASDYKYYGGKGVKVIYTSKQFYAWFKKHRTLISLGIKVNVDRINHSKNYSLSNVRLIPKIDNVIESNQRRAKLKLDKVLVDMNNGLTQKQIAVKYDTNQSCVSVILKRNNIKWKV